MQRTLTPPSAPPRQRRKEARPQELLDAALELFAEKGFAATRSEEVAARAGVAKGTLYLYYPSKEELLKAVISQRLVMGKDGHRLPAVEVLLNTPHIRDLLRRGQIHEVKEAMDRSLQEGMQTFDQSLYALYKEGKIELEEALNHADSRDGLALKIRLAEGADSPMPEAFDVNNY